MKTRRFSGELNKGRDVKAGMVRHLRVEQVAKVKGLGPHFWFQDITPLPGAEPPGYACWSCGIVEPAKEDGSLPEGWTMKEYGDGVNYPKGHHFFCDEDFCQKSRMCRLCGCNDDHACDPPCAWIEDDRCSGCAS